MVPRRPRRRARDLIPITGLLLFALAARLTVALSVPPWQGPDEPKHFEYVRTLLDKRDQLWAERRLPTLDDGIPALQQQIIASMAQYHFWAFLGRATPAPLPASFRDAFGESWTQLHRPSLYYDLGAIELLPLQGQPIETQLVALRALSAVLSALAVLPAFAIGRLVAPQDAFVATACAALAAMLPMGVFIGGVANNDNLLLLFGTLATLGMVRGVVRGFSGRTWLLIVGGSLLGLLTKRGAAILLPGVGVCGIIWLARLHPARRRRVLVALGVAVVVVVGGVVLGWISHTLPVERVLSTVSDYALNSPSQLTNLLQVPLTTEQTRQIVAAELEAYFKSFWGIFGWFAILLAPAVYATLWLGTAACAVGGLGWVLGLGAGSAMSAKVRAALAAVFATAVAAAIVAGIAERLAYYSPGEVPQGRYLFVVLGAIAALYAVGARTWLVLARRSTLVPRLLVVGGLIALDVYAYLGTILPFYARSLP